jgi:hypothetical protein
MLASERVAGAGVISYASGRSMPEQTSIVFLSGFVMADGKRDGDGVCYT